MLAVCLALTEATLGGLYRRQEYTEERRQNMPKMFPMLSLLRNWPTDSTTVPASGVYDSLEHLDYQNTTDLARAMALRKLEIPFIVHNIPNINGVVGKWKADEYLINGLGGASK